MNSLLIRTDATPKTGAGHFMRCLALAQAWRERGNSVFFAISHDSIIPFPEKIPHDVKIRAIYAPIGSPDDANQTVNLAKDSDCSWIIIDGYNFHGAFQKTIRDSGINLLVIDDYAHADFYLADIILNQNMYASPEIYYKRNAGSELLLGSRYVLLRPEFRKWNKWQRDIPLRAKKILVTMGGSDQKNASLMVLRGLQYIDDPDTEVCLVTGFHHPFRSQLEKELPNCRFKLKIIDNVSDMAELIAWADVGISAAGSTSWEIAFLGLPSLLISLSENQVPVAQILEKNKICISLGSFDTLSQVDLQEKLLEMMENPQLRRELSRNGRLFIDGGGPERVIMNMMKDPLRLRDITSNDCELFWKWANNPDVRKNAFEQNQIDLPTHCKWFERKLQSSDSYIYIAVDASDNPVGQIRFDCSNDTAVIDISVDSSQRNKGLGRAILTLGIRKIRQKTRIKTLFAEVKTTNVPSQKTFEMVGFTLQKTGIVKGVEVYTYTYTL